MNHIGLFEGIGGFSLAANWMGWQTIAWCEWNPFGQRVLKHHFPNATGHGNITKTDFTIYRGQCDILTGGFPCQPYSTAGKRLGKEDERHLWPEMLRAIREIQPTWVVGENVSGLISWNGGLVFDEVQTDLEAEGYEVQSFVLPACAVNAPHRRDRVWFVAYAAGSRSNRAKEHENCMQNSGNREQSNYIDNNGKVWGPTSHPESIENFGNRPGGFFPEPTRANEQGTTTHPDSTGWYEECQPAAKPSQQKRQHSEADFRSKPGGWQDFPTQSPVCGRNDGLSSELDGITFSKWRNESIKAYGNAIVPQVAYEIFKAIEVLANDNFNTGC